MAGSKKLPIILGIVLLVCAGTVAIALPGKRQFKNLKVLPKNISKDELDEIMSNFQDALGVKCNFCHTSPSKDQQTPDFASDDKPEKNIARKMMRMTTRLNRKYFSDYKQKENGPIEALSCVTCHHGKPDAGEKH